MTKKEMIDTYVLGEKHRTNQMKYAYVSGENAFLNKKHKLNSNHFGSHFGGGDDKECFDEFNRGYDDADKIYQLENRNPITKNELCHGKHERLYICFQMKNTVKRCIVHFKNVNSNRFMYGFDSDHNGILYSISIIHMHTLGKFKPIEIPSFLEEKPTCAWFESW